MIEDTQADQLISQLFMEPFDTLSLQYKDIRHLHVEVGAKTSVVKIETMSTNKTQSF